MSKPRVSARRRFGAHAQKSAKYRMPSEIEFRKEVAVILKIAGYTVDQIAASIGEAFGTVKGWLNEPEVEKRYVALSHALSHSARTLLETYTIEAVQTIVTVMRTSGTDKIILEAAREILDRGGLPKASKSESTSVNVSQQQTEITDTTFIEKLRKASPEVQEQAAQAIEQLENLLAEHSDADPT